MPASSSSETATSASPSGLLSQYGARIGRDTLIYGTGNTALLAVTLITLTVFTHYMPPSEYGKLSILFFFAGLLTILLNLVPLAGILRWVWVAGEADSGAVDDPSRQAPGGTKRRALGTGCWMSLFFIVVGCGVVIPFAAPLAQLLVGHSSAKDDVLLAIASGAAGSIFRLTTNVVRMERRPVAFSVLIAARPTVALLVALPLVINGDAVSGALVGTIFGSLIPAVIAVIISRHSYSLQFSWTDVRGISDLGLKYTFVISGLWVVHNGDAFVLSRFTSHTEVGIYRVAARLGAVLSYLVASFLQAWSPLERGPLFQSTYEVHGLQRVHSRMITYFVLCALTIMLALSLSGDLVVRLAPPAYSSAAGLIPFTSFFFVVYGVFVLIARTTYHTHRDFVHQFSAAFAAVVYVGMAVLLVPRWGGYGLAIGASIAMALACVCFRVIAPTASHYAILEWPRLLGGGLIAIGCVVLGLVPDVGHGVDRALLGLVVFFVVYPALMILTGVVPRSELRMIRDVAAGTIRQYAAPFRRRARGAEATQALAELEPGEIVVLRGLIRDRNTPTVLAQRLGLPVSVVEARAARALLRLADADAAERDDTAIGHWLFAIRSSAERDVVMYSLINHGIPVTTLHGAEAALGGLKRIPSDLWPADGARRLPAGDMMAPLEASLGLS